MAFLKLFTVFALMLSLLGCGAALEKKNQAKSHFTLGLSHLQSGSATLALQEFLLAEQFDSKDAQIQAALGQAYQAKKAYAKAEEHYLRALKLSDDEPRYQNNLAALYIDMEEWDKAITYFTRASENLLFLRTEVALMGVGYARFRKGDYPAALSAYQEARAIAPGYAPIALRMGEVFYTLGQDGSARSEFERALEQAPNYAEAHYRLALVHLREKRLAAAGQSFRRVVELAPQSEWGQNAAGYLKTLQ